jgi:hypothetical protein
VAKLLPTFKPTFPGFHLKYMAQVSRHHGAIITISLQIILTASEDALRPTYQSLYSVIWHPPRLWGISYERVQSPLCHAFSCYVQV